MAPKTTRATRCGDAGRSSRVGGEARLCVHDGHGGAPGCGGADVAVDQGGGASAAAESGCAVACADVDGVEQGARAVSCADAERGAASAARGRRDGFHVAAGVAEEPSIYGEHGPFARLVMVLALLRGIIEMLEAERPGAAAVVVEQVAQAGLAIRGRLDGGRAGGAVQARAVSLAQGMGWRRHLQARSVKKAGQAGQTAQTSGAASDMSDDSLSTHSGSPTNKRAWPAELQPTLFTPLTASGATPLSDDALPLYWLAHVLVTHARRTSGCRCAVSKAGRARRAQRCVCSQGEAGEMPDFRAMLRFARILSRAARSSG